MKRFHQIWHDFHADQSGQDLIEYALMVALVTLGAVTTMKALATSIGNFWNLFIAKIMAIWPS